VVQLTKVNKYFGDLHVLRDIDLSVGSGEVVVVIGPSGSGKSTLCRTINRLEPIDSGEIRIDGQPLPAEGRALAQLRADVGMVFQSFNLFAHKTVLENVTLGPIKVRKKPKGDAEEKAMQLLRRVGVANQATKYPAQLSGGQQQRVAMGRAMVRQPKVYLFDEPLSNLDARLRAQMRVEITRLQRELGTTMIYVTHDQVEAMTLADHVVVLDRGRVAQAGPPLDIYNAPANLFVAGFLGSPPMNLYPTRVLERREGTLSVALPRGARVALRPTGPSPEGGATVTLGIRPEHLQLGAQAPPEDGATLEAAVTRVERLGAQSHVALSCEDMELVAVADGEARISAGERLRVHLPARRCRLFDAEGQAV